MARTPKPVARPVPATASWARLVSVVDRSLTRELGVARGKEPPRLQVDGRLRLRGVDPSTDG